MPSKHACKGRMSVGLAFTHEDKEISPCRSLDLATRTAVEICNLIEPKSKSAKSRGKIYAVPIDARPDSHVLTFGFMNCDTNNLLFDPTMNDAARCLAQRINRATQLVLAGHELIGEFVRERPKGLRWPVRIEPAPAGQLELARYDSKADSVFCSEPAPVDLVERHLGIAKKLSRLCSIGVKVDLVLETETLRLLAAARHTLCANLSPGHLVTGTAEITGLFTEARLAEVHLEGAVREAKFPEGLRKELQELTGKHACAEIVHSKSAAANPFLPTRGTALIESVLRVVTQGRLNSDGYQFAHERSMIG